MVGSGTTYTFTPEIKYSVKIDGETSTGSEIKLGALVEIKFNTVMGNRDFYIDSCEATENADGTGKNLTLVSGGCVGDKSVSRELINSLIYLRSVD